MGANEKVTATFHGVDLSLHLAGGPNCPTGCADHEGPAAPDLTPEQALRAHVADLLSDVDHFDGCHRYVEGDGTCTCLLGRITWAIEAEQVTEPRQDGAA